MRHADSIERLEGALAAVGSFDGIHLGHQAVLRTLAEESKRQGRPSAVVSFFWEKSQEALTTELEKAYYMEKLGVDVMLSLPGEAYAGAEALKELLTEKMNVGGIVAGTGCPEQRCLKAWGIPWYPVDAVEIGGKPVTAARVRDCLDGGRMEELERLCGHPYFMLGKVVHGRALGRTVGMPTANLKIYGTKRRPPNGVYATRTYIEGKPSWESQTWGCALRWTTGMRLPLKRCWMILARIFTVRKSSQSFPFSCGKPRSWTAWRPCAGR